MILLSIKYQGDKSESMYKFRKIIILLSICLIAFLMSWQSDNYKKNLLILKDADGQYRNISCKEDWYKRREQILDSIQLVMGPLPDSFGKVQLDVKVIEEVNIERIRRLKISFAVEKNDGFLPIYLFLPVQGFRYPEFFAFIRQSVLERTNLRDWEAVQTCNYALELARRGYVTLAPDYPNFGEYSYDPYSNGYSSASMKGIWNHMAAVDLLQSLPEVDPERIGCIGHSLGGHNSLFLAVFDTRIKAVVTSCGFTSFYKYYGGDLTGWSHKGYMPRIASIYERIPPECLSTSPKYLGAIAPRALFINAPLRDSNFEISGVYDCVNAAKPVYELFNAGDKLMMINPDAPHDFPPEATECSLFSSSTKNLSFSKKCIHINKFNHMKKVIFSILFLPDCFYVIFTAE